MFDIVYNKEYNVSIWGRVKGDTLTDIELNIYTLTGRELLNYIGYFFKSDEILRATHNLETQTICVSYKQRITNYEYDYTIEYSLMEGKEVRKGAKHRRRDS